jgi:hypothetical protein
MNSFAYFTTLTHAAQTPLIEQLSFLDKLHSMFPRLLSWRNRSLSDPGTSHTELRYGDGSFSKEIGLALTDKEFLGVTHEDLLPFDSSVYMLRLGYRANSLQTKHPNTEKLHSILVAGGQAGRRRQNSNPSRTK